MTTKSNKCSLFLTLRDLGFSVNRINLRALTLVGPIRNNPALDPLATTPRQPTIHVTNMSSSALWKLTKFEAVKQTNGELDAALTLIGSILKIQDKQRTWKTKVT